MKAIIEVDFLCGYYHQAALAAKNQILLHKLPESLNHAITALVLWQCVCESYINFLIHKRKLEDHQIQVQRNGQQRKIRLMDASIKEKWLHFPRITVRKDFIANAEPFSYFTKLVELRNDLIHFNVSKLSFEKQVPEGITTKRQLLDWMGAGNYFADTVFDRIMRFALAGELIVRDILMALHNMLGTKPPEFLIGKPPILKVTIKKP